MADVAAIEVGGLNLDPHSMRRLHVKLEGQRLDIGSVDIALVR